MLFRMVKLLLKLDKHEKIFISITQKSVRGKELNWDLTLFAFFVAHSKLLKNDWVNDQIEEMWTYIHAACKKSYHCE